MLARILRAGAVLPLIFAASLSVARPSVALTTFYVDGTIKNSATGAGIADACVVFGLAIIVCATHSNANGYYKIDANVPDLPGGQ